MNIHNNEVKETNQPTSSGIRYCSTLLWVQSAILVLLPTLFFSSKNTNTGAEKAIFTVMFIATGLLGLVAGKKLMEAEQWAWVTAIAFFSITLGSPMLPFSAVGLYLLLKAESVAHFTHPHIHIQIESEQKS